VSSLRLVLPAGLRLRWRPLLALSLLLGVIGGVVLGAAAGARRTDTAYPRLLAWAHAAQIRIIPTAGPGYGYGGFFRDLRGLPQVATMSTTSLYNMILPHSRRRQIEAMSSPDGRTGATVDRVKLIAGHPFGPSSTGQAMVDEQTARREHLRPGSMLRVLAVPYDKRGNPAERRAVPLAFRVSAIVVFDGQIVPVSGSNKLPTVMLSPSFSTPRNELSYGYGTTADVRLKPGASTTAFLRSVRRLAVKYLRTAPIDVITLAEQVAATEGAIRPQAIAMALFAAAAALIGLAIISQLVSRQLRLDSAEFPIMRAVGMTRAQLVAVALARIGLLTLASAAVAVALAIAASPLLPIGPARQAEPHPGIEVNLAILGAGFALIVVLPLLLALPAAWSAASQELGPQGVAEFGAAASGRGLASWLGRAGLVPGAIGVRMALEPGRGRTAVPVRSALVGTVMAVTALVAAVVFGASMARLVGSPQRYGQRWQLEMNFGFGGLNRQLVARIIAHEPGVSGYAAGDYGQVRVGGAVIAAIGVDQVRGSGYVTVLAGRPPRAPGEIVLGSRTLHALRKRVGDSIAVLVNGRTRPVRIVGEGVFASFSRGAFAATDLGNGAATTASFLSMPDKETNCPRGPCYNFLLVRFRPGTDLQVAREHLVGIARRLGCPPGSCVVSPDQRPTDIRNYASVRDTPMLLGGVLVLLAIGTLTHVLVTGVRRRRRDLSMLKTLGMLRRQVLATVLWQATALAAAALIVGVPLGITAGRLVWELFAGSVGVAPDPDVPLTGMLVILAAAVVAANLVALLPGWTAARIRPASTLRTE
jgi:ABC-type antimicrobial peptide transport system permease subunit